MNIGKASKLTGLSTKTIRYYEDIDLVHPSHRKENGYRHYSDSDIHQLQFIHKARKTGFNIDECRQLLALFNDESRKSKHVQGLVLEKAARVEKQIQELQWMHNYLIELASHCKANEQPHCAILDELNESDVVSGGTNNE